MTRGFRRHVDIDHIRAAPLFARCTRRELERIARAGERREVAAGSVLAEQGERGDEAYVVIDGAITVRRNGRKVATLGPGAIAGELALLDDGTRTATLGCEQDSSIFVIGRAEFLPVLHDVPAIGHKLAAALCGRVRELDSAYYG